MEKILYLTLKKQWFDMILSGEKKEEYREIKAYWFKRLCYFDREIETYDEIIGDANNGLSRYQDVEDYKKYFGIKFKDYTHIVFSNGYAKDRPQFKIEIKNIDISTGVNAWGGSIMRLYFVLSLGEVI